MKLYHYTSTLHIPLIRSSGVLRYGDIPLKESSKYGENGHAVWLTTHDYANRNEHGLISPICDKSEVRFTIPNCTKEAPWLFKWSRYAELNKVKRNWYETLDDIGMGLAETWWLYVGTIPIADLEVAIKKNGIYEPVDINQISSPLNVLNTMHTKLGVLVPV